jgi:hypothetical protein
MSDAAPEADLAEQLERAIGSVRYVHQEFPIIAARLPPDLKLFSRGFGVGDGACTHPDLLDDGWLAYWGGRRFAAADVPDGFTAAGTKNAGGSEYVFVMWRRGDRTLWFQDQYVNFHVGGYQDATRQRLADLFLLWDQGTSDIIQSGTRDLSKGAGGLR